MDKAIIIVFNLIWHLVELHIHIVYEFFNKNHKMICVLYFCFRFLFSNCEVIIFNNVGTYII